MVHDVLDDMSPFFSANGGKARSTMVYLFPFLIAMRMILARNWISSQTWLRSTRP
ncbi:unnamed protein product [Prunus armeniaca]